MQPIRHVAVIDIGKTNAKVALVDMESLSETAVRKTPNKVRHDGPYPHHDTEALWSFIQASLSELNVAQPIDAISVTTHGATAALVDGNGGLALPILDYESSLPDATSVAYRAARPDFTETGAPLLPVGLNLAAQIFWQQAAYPEAFAGVAAILMYPQYWVYRLTGVMASEVTSLGCHTDLWNPVARTYSSLVERQGWLELMPPLRSARDRIGPVLPAIAGPAALRPGVPVFCGIHDSNASLLPHLQAWPKPFSVVSTGTWVISMAVGGSTAALDPARDTLVNVSADGDPVPSARFMGGREYEIMTGGQPAEWGDEDVSQVLARPLFLLPSVEQGSGPFPARRSTWVNDAQATDAERQIALSYYLAMMTTVSLELIGAASDTIVEGPFARNRAYLSMLAAATGRKVICGSSGGTGTAIGAALLTLDAGKRLDRSALETTESDPRLARYAEAWKALLLAGPGSPP